MNYEPFTSIENPTLAHFRHFIRRGGFSSLFTNSHLYNCRESSTNQLFFNKQSQFRESSNERKYLLYKGLSNFIPLAGYKNKPNSNPIKPNLRKAKMNVNLTLAKDYRKKDDFAVRKNKANFRNGQNECNLKYNKGLWQFSNRGYEKTNPNKPNFKRRTYSLTGQSGFINMVSGKIIDKAFAEVTGAWWCPWSSKPVWG